MPTGTSEEVLLPGYYVDPVAGAWMTLPWPRDPQQRQDLARTSLGPGLIDWSEGRTDEPGLIHYLTGEPWQWTRGQKRFLILWYSLKPDVRFRFRSGVKRGAKGTGKDPMFAAWSLMELLGPARPIGFDQTGRAVGERHRMPLVQIASNSESQSKDVLRLANAMLTAEARAYYGVDAGETRTIIDGGGRLEVLTASVKTSEGDPATAIGLNESHHMTDSSGGHALAEVARRNVGKSPAIVQARLLEFTNAHPQGADSVAERSYEAWLAQAAGLTKRQDILYDSIEADPSLDMFDDDERALSVRQAYSDAPWADHERIGDEMLDPRTSVADSIRFYRNGLAAAEDAWIDPVKFDALTKPSRVIEDREQIAMFLDCSKSEDATALVGCCISDGHVFTLGVWQRSRSMDKKKIWRVPREQVDAVVDAAFGRYRVVWFGVDPSPAKDDEAEALYWAGQLKTWHQKYRKKVVVWATPGERLGSSVVFDMRLSQPGGRERMRRFTQVAEETVQAIDEDGSLSWDGDPALRLHTHQAKARKNEWGTSLGKVTRDSSKLVDLAVCMVGARMGRDIALASGKVRKRRSSSSGRALVMS